MLSRANKDNQVEINARKKSNKIRQIFEWGGRTQAKG